MSHLRKLERACDRADARPDVQHWSITLAPGEIIATTRELRRLIARLRKAEAAVDDAPASERARKAEAACSRLGAENANLRSRIQVLNEMLRDTLRQGNP